MYIKTLIEISTNKYCVWLIYAQINPRFGEVLIWSKGSYKSGTIFRASIVGSIRYGHFGKSPSLFITFSLS
jgi:hypothetical protein